MPDCSVAHGRERLIAGLLNSDEPAIRWRTRVRVLGEDPESGAAKQLAADVRASPRVGALLAGGDGGVLPPHSTARLTGAVGSRSIKLTVCHWSRWRHMGATFISDLAIRTYSSACGYR
jgi:hypothetical protein